MFSIEQRSGIFLLFFLIMVFQVFWYNFDFTFNKNTIQSKEEKEWLSNQRQIDSLKITANNDKYVIKPFNPNFISDYKGYLLGMSTQEIDRLHKFRATDKYVNSAKEFQQVTKVSDELLNKIKSKFKFPDWVTNKENKKPFTDYNNTASNKFQSQNPYEKKQIVQKDINLSSKEELMEVYGIGDKISDIILQERSKFGAFASMEQLQFVWGVSPEVYQQLQKRFFVNPNQSINKIAINNLSMKELSKFPYFNYTLAREIVAYRSMNDYIKNIEDLTKIKGMPNEKIKIIALYLEF